MFGIFGADRVLVIALRHDEPSPSTTTFERETQIHQYPDAMFLFGKLLDALLLDPIRYDLAVLERINQILEHGAQVYGGSFYDELNRVVEPLRGKAYRRIDDVMIHPSEDIGRIAAQEAAQLTLRDWGAGPAALLFRRFASVDTQVEADLLASCKVDIDSGLRSEF